MVWAIWTTSGVAGTGARQPVPFWEAMGDETGHWKVATKVAHWLTIWVHVQDPVRFFKRYKCRTSLTVLTRRVARCPAQSGVPHKSIFPEVRLSVTSRPNSRKPIRQKCADTVAEVVGGHDRRKDRIRIPVATNRSCVAVHRCEAMLRARACKILLQQYLPEADLVCWLARTTTS